MAQIPRKLLPGIWPWEEVFYCHAFLMGGSGYVRFSAEGSAIVESKDLNSVYMRDAKMQKGKRVALSHFQPNAERSVVQYPLNEHAPPLGGFAGPGYVSIRLLPTCLFSPGTARMHSIVSLEIVKHEKLA